MSYRVTENHPTVEKIYSFYKNHDQFPYFVNLEPSQIKEICKDILAIQECQEVRFCISKVGIISDKVALCDRLTSKIVKNKLFEKEIRIFDEQFTICKKLSTEEKIKTMLMFSKESTTSQILNLGEIFISKEMESTDKIELLLQVEGLIDSRMQRGELINLQAMIGSGAIASALLETPQSERKNVVEKTLILFRMAKLDSHCSPDLEMSHIIRCFSKMPSHERLEFLKLFASLFILAPEFIDRGYIVRGLFEISQKERNDFVECVRALPQEKRNEYIEQKF